MADSIAFLITRPPYGAEEAFAGMRAALAMLASGNIGRATCVLVGDGTLNAIKTQNPNAIQMPSNVEAVDDLIDFEGEVYALAEDLRERVGDVPVLDSVKLVVWERAREVLRDHKLVTTF
jgi:tRNA 2-thiouridine synthesizing protein D